MSLGVLNNINAIYAENNLNNTSNSLSKVLTQLSSGSKINSGSDDAAGLSLVNGLQANSQALMQSGTNASEGVGLLSVADGALSQVTNLLNRAVTLATEASNGTLNSAQDTAANQEYQSILSEISNIGSTTTYNNTAVFGTTTNIFTGDSSTAGASINSLNIRSLSSTNVGDSNGAMAYSNGTNNVFLDLSSGGKNAATSDSLGAATATTTIAVNYVTTGSNGAAVNATANISVGAGTSFANTTQGLISAINGAGLGLTAAFGTAAQAGTAGVKDAGAANTAGGGSTDTGIIISGVGVGTGTNGAGEVGTLTIGAAADTLTGGTVSITGSDGKTHNLTLGLANSTDTLANLASTINAAGYGVTATVNANELNGNAANTQLTFTSANSAVTVGSANLTASAGTLVLSGTPTINNAPTTYNVGTLTTSNANQAYTGGVLSIGSNASITLGTAGGKTDNITDLAATINAGNYGVTATADSAGKVLTFTSANASDAFSATTAVTVAAGTAATSINVANQNQIGTVSFSGVGALTGDTTTAGGTITVGGTVFTATATDTLTTMAAKITASNIGVTASMNAATEVVNGVTYNAGTYMTLTATNSTSQGATLATTLVDSVTAGTSKTQDTPAVGNTAYYSVGISGSVADTTTGGGTLNAGLVANNNGSGGVATISYSDAAGQSLAATDLTTQGDAQATLTALNKAITAVAAQDGYIGAQINTLNSVSSVLATQSENVTSAQNAVQATDYASATSNMSKYQILSQTGISALAQANSMQQEVTKLLQ
jgi:flagellin